MASAAALFSADLTVPSMSRTVLAQPQRASNLCVSLIPSFSHSPTSLQVQGGAVARGMIQFARAREAIESAEDVDEDDEDEDSEEGWQSELLDELNPVVYLQRHNPRGKGRRRKEVLGGMLPSSSAPEAGAPDWAERARHHALQSLEARNPAAAIALKKKMEPASDGRKQRKKKEKKKKPQMSSSLRSKVPLKKLEHASRLQDDSSSACANDDEADNSLDDPGDEEFDLDGIDSIDDLAIGNDLGYGRWNADIKGFPTGHGREPGLAADTSKAFVLAFENASERSISDKQVENVSKVSPPAFANAAKQGSEREIIFNKQIVGAKTALEVLEIVGDAEERSRLLGLPSLLTPLNAATALHRIGKHMETSGTLKADRLDFARKRYMAELVARSMVVLAGCSAQGLSNIGWALSKIGGSVLYSVEMDLLGKAVLQKISEFNSQNVANILGAYAAMQHASPTVFAGLCNRAADILEEFSCQELAQVLWAYAELMQPADPLLDALDGVCLSLGKGISDSLANSDLNNPQWEHFLSSIISVGKLNPFGNASAEHLANLGWSYAVLDQINRPAFKHIWQMLESVVNQNANSTGDITSGLSTWHLSQIHQVNLCLQYGYSDLSSTLRPVLKDASAHAWETQKRNTWSPSEYQKDVKWFLVSLGQNWVDEYPTADYSLDLALPERNMAIEIDGPSHFIRNNGLPLGHTILKRRLLSQAGWVILPISYERWEELDGETQKADFLKELLRVSG